MTNENALDERWRSALHEAGHALCVFAYGNAPKSAWLMPLGGGNAWLGELPASATAIATAAGKAAEALADHVVAPELTFAGTFLLDVRQDVAKREQERQPQAPPPELVRDEVHLARWAIEGYEDFPERWAGRVAWAKTQTEAFVSDNAGAIVALAKRMYEQGRIGPEDFEALGLTKEPAHVAAADTAASAAQPPA